MVINLPEGVDPLAAEAALSLASSAVLGYDQPVEEKPIGEEVEGTENEASGDES